MTNSQKIKKIYNFVHELRSLKEIERYSNNPFVKRKDVVASHSFRAETFPILLFDQFSQERLNPLRILELLHIHDWVEMESSKVEALGFRDRNAKAAREAKMWKKLIAKFSVSEWKRVRDLLKEMMNQETRESKVAKALENLESNMHVIEEVKPISDSEHRQRTIDYIERRRGISKTIDSLINLQLSEIESVSKKRIK